jgi:hypothetical protein
MTELVYATERTGLERGRSFRNPRFFTGTEDGVSRVIVVGDWPAVVRAYKAEGAEVVQGKDADAVRRALASPPAQAAESAYVSPQEIAEAARAAVDIPETWRELPWPERRRLAQNFSTDRVLNRALAAAAITAELARRGPAVGEPEPEPTTDEGPTCEDVVW